MEQLRTGQAIGSLRRTTRRETENSSEFRRFKFLVEAAGIVSESSVKYGAYLGGKGLQLAVERKVDLNRKHLLELCLRCGVPLKASNCSSVEAGQFKKEPGSRQSNIFMRDGDVGLERVCKLCGYENWQRFAKMEDAERAAQAQQRHIDRNTTAEPLNERKVPLPSTDSLIDTQNIIPGSLSHGEETTKYQSRQEILGRSFPDGSESVGTTVRVVSNEIDLGFKERSCEAPRVGGSCLGLSGKELPESGCVNNSEQGMEVEVAGKLPVSTSEANEIMGEKGDGNVHVVNNGEGKILSRECVECGPGGILEQDVQTEAAEKLLESTSKSIDLADEKGGKLVGTAHGELVNVVVNDGEVDKLCARCPDSGCMDNLKQEMEVEAAGKLPVSTSEANETMHQESSLGVNAALGVVDANTSQVDQATLPETEAINKDEEAGPHSTEDVFECRFECGNEGKDTVSRKEVGKPNDHTIPDDRINDRGDVGNVQESGGCEERPVIAHGVYEGNLCVGSEGGGAGEQEERVDDLGRKAFRDVGLVTDLKKTADKCCQTSCLLGARVTVRDAGVGVGHSKAKKGKKRKSVSKSVQTDCEGRVDADHVDKRLVLGGETEFPILSGELSGKISGVFDARRRPRKRRVGEEAEEKLEGSCVGSCKEAASGTGDDRNMGGERNSSEHVESDQTNQNLTKKGNKSGRKRFRTDLLNLVGGPTSTWVIASNKQGRRRKKVKKALW